VALHLHPTTELAPRVLLPGDPGRALALAQQLLDAPRMFNHHRGLWGYSGTALHDGVPLTIQSTGMGGPSAAIVICELAELGARTLLRIGTCGAIAAGPGLGDVLVVTEALARDGCSRALGAGDRVRASAPLLASLRAAGDGTREVVAASSDLFYDPRPGAGTGWAAEGASVVEMVTATLFTLGATRELQVGALLAVSELVAPPRRRIDPDGLRDAERRLGDLAVRALAGG
jgi:uridine phosphorylase